MSELKQISYQNAMMMARRGGVVSRESWRVSDGLEDNSDPKLIFVKGTVDIVPEGDTPYARFGVERLNIGSHYDRLCEGVVECGWQPTLNDMRAKDWYVVGDVV